MVAVVNGSGLGLFTSNGSTGAAGLGQSRERVFVNSTTGNLVIQEVDELLTANGNDFALTRTYNSLGYVDGDNDDGWRMGVLKSLALVGSPTAPDRIIKTFGDGAQITYTLNGGVYRSTDGDGAHDTLQLVSNQWIWTDGSGRNTETYNTDGQILNSKDADGNTFTYGYTNSLITSIIIVSPPVNAAVPEEGGDGSTTTISLDYLEPTGRKLLQRVRVTRTGTPEQTLTSYGYDAQNRLETVTVDLTPENTGDSSTYITTYTYEGTSKRIASITQRAGGTSNVTSSVSFHYDLLNGDYRLKDYTDGEGHTTTFTYSLVNGGGGTSTTLPANSGALQTTETQNVSNNYTLNPSAVSTTDTQTNNNSYNVNNSQITTGATQTDTYNRNDAALSTTDTQTTTTNYNVNSAQITTGATQTDTYNRNDAALSTTDTTTSPYNVNSSALTTNATQTDVYNRNDTALSTTDTTTTTNSYNLNSGALTIPGAGPASGAWGTFALMDPGLGTSVATTPKVAFDSNGDGFAIWSRAHTGNNGSDLVVSRYTRSTNTWSTPAILGSTTNAGSSTSTAIGASLAVDTGGNAVVAWRGPASATTGTIYVKRYAVSTGTWDSTAVNVGAGRGAPVVAINGTAAAITWTNGTSTDLLTSRWSGSAWLAGQAMESSSTAVADYAVAVDGLGNVLVLMAQGTSIYRNRFDAAAGTWSGQSASMGTNSGNQVRIALDANGDGFASWRNGANLMVSRYTRSTNVFAAAAAIDGLSTTVNGHALAVDANGNAVIAWTQNDGNNSAFARLYSASSSSWGAITTLESSQRDVTTAARDIAVSIKGSRAAVAWIQDSPATGYDAAYGAVYNGTSWSSSAALEMQTSDASAPTIALDSLGNATALWQFNGGGLLYGNRFTVDSGGTWTPSATLGAGAEYAVTNSHIAYASNGDGVAAWIVGQSIFTRRYIAATNTWQAAVERSAPGTTVMDAVALRLAVDPVTGSAAIAWIQVVDGEDSMFMAYMDASGNWTAGASIESNPGEVGIYEEYFGVSVAGTRAAVTFGQDVNGEESIYLARMNSGVLSATQLVDSLATGASQPRVAVDSSGNAMVVWQQVSLDGGAHTYYRRWNAATQTFSSASSLDDGSDWTRAPELAFDQQGNGIAVFLSFDRGLIARRYTASTGLWGAEVALQSLVDDAHGVRFAMDSAGNAIVGWVQIDANSTYSMFVNQFSASTGSWTGATELDSSSAPVNPDEHVAVAINGSYAAAAWVQSSNDNDVFSARFVAGAWTTPRRMESLDAAPTSLDVAVDSTGRVGLTWLQPDENWTTAPWLTQFSPGTGTPYYLVPSGATWQTVANALYGINSAAAGSALQTAMGNPALTTGAQLTGWPAILSVTTSTTVTVPAYYNVPAGASWQSIANAVYGINNAAAGNALQTAMGNPTLATGLHLTGFPATLSVTTTLPAHYLVPSGASWQSIANALYGVNSAAAGSALQSALGNPSIAAGQRLYGIPGALSVATTVTVPPYYNVQAGATWQSIANSVYGINTAAAGSALQSAMGNPTLTTGLHLTGFPPSLSITTTLAPHYLVPASATWQSIASTLYGVNSTAAGAALQSALGNPSIAAGTRLYSIPATLSVTTTQTVTVPPYYTIPAGASWQSIANVIYGINSAAAGSALQSAMGNPALTAGNRLANFPATITVVTSLAPHYLVPTGATWQSVANTLYGVNNVAAGAALQAALGNPALAAGVRLYNLPATLTVTTTSTITVPPYYVIPSTPSWQTIAATIYGIDSSAAGSALQSALGNPALTPGNRLSNLPAALTVTTQQTVSVAPYYIVLPGATWGSITQAVYGSSAAGAIAALQAACGNPPLTTNLHLPVPANLTYSTATATTANTLPGSLVTQEQITDHHADPMTATLSTTQQVTTNTDFGIQGSQFQQTRVVPFAREYGPVSGLSTSETQTHTLDLQTSQLTTPPAGWIVNQTISGATANISEEQVKFDASGNGIAVWKVAGFQLRFARYSASTKTWSAIQTQVINTDTTRIINGYSLAIDGAGNAVVSWCQGTMGVANGAAATVFASIFNPSTGVWSTPTTIGSVYRDFTVTTAIRGGAAAVVYTASAVPILSDGTGNTTDGDRLYVARYSAGSWASTTSLNGAYATQLGTEKAAVGIDSSGIINVAWTEGDVSQGFTVARRFVNNAWQASQAIATWGNRADVFETYGGFAASGDGFITVSNAVYKYTKATNTWAVVSGVNVAGQTPKIDVDDSGTAALVYRSGLTLSALTYNGTSWSAPFAMSTNSMTNSFSVAVLNGRAIVGWNEPNGSNGNAFARTYDGSTWDTAFQLGTSIGGSRRVNVALDSTTDMHAFWAKGTSGTSYDVVDNRFVARVNAPPYITLDADPTWQEVANLLYGENRAEAGAALQVAMPGKSLTPNGTLSGFPPKLTYTAAFTVAPYYLIPSGWTMQQVANAIYGGSVPNPEGGAALQALIDNQTVTKTGNKLAGLPTMLNVTAPEARPANPYFVVTSANWQDIAATLYNINSPAAGAELQRLKGGASPPAVNSELLQQDMPASITVPVTTTQNVAPYYLVPASASWQSVALALYNVNTPAAGQALQNAMAALQPPVNTLPYGGPLRGMPSTLTYDTTRMADVTPYYVVVAGDTWATIASRVYGTNVNETAAANELQRVVLLNTPSATLTANYHLYVPSGITYVPTLGTTTVFQQTDVQDALGLVTSYKSTVQGRLVSTLSPAIGGVRLETRYDYDVDGNITAVTLDPGGLNRVNAMTYDANGNVTSSRDSAGNTVTRLYDPTTNQLSSETVYLVPDPDGFGSQSAQSPLTTRYFYDSESHLRFVVSPDGRVVEHNYFQAGTRQYTRGYGGTAYSGTFTLAALTTWAAGRTPVELTQYSYDFRGNLANVKRFDTTDASGNGTGVPSVTTFVYDARGNLLTVIDPRGTGTSDPNDYKTSYVYDGLGRLTQKVEWLSSTDTRTTLSTFDDANRGVVTRINSTLSPLGRVTTTAYDRSGAIVSIANADTSSTSYGSTLFAYDVDNRLRMTTDAMGVRSYILYDTLGRKTGEVDADGRLTRYVYNRAGQVVKTVRYSSLLSSTALATLVSAGAPANVTVDSLVSTLTLDATKDQTTRLVYDNAGRLVYSIDAGGFVTQSFYDGASRITDVVQFATGITVAASVDELAASAVNVTSSMSDRRQRNFYNGDGMLVGSLDAAGYLIELVYDSFGHLQKQTAYANPTTAADRANGSFATLKTSADDDPTHDINSYFWYDAQGRTIGVLDAEGYLTETKYDLAGYVSQRIRYEKQAAYDASLTNVRNAATGTKNQTTAFGYDGAGRLISQTNFEGTLSGFQYNAFDEVTSATTGNRTVQKRYNAMGWMTQELSGEGSAQITGGMTQTQIDAVWSHWAITHAYDSAGRRKSTTDQYGNKTFFYYDVDGRVRFTVRDLGNGTGEASEARYNALGQLTDSLTHSTRISTAGLVGGLVDSTITSAVSNDAADAHTYLTYKLTGATASTRNQEGAQTDYTYDAFGDVTNKFEKIASSVTTEHRYGYDARGLLTSTRWDATGINRSETRIYDAFGRVKSITDQYGRSTSSDYDRLGRVVATHGGIAGEDARIEYDSFGRVLKVYDAYNNLTSYSYDDALKRSVMTTPENVTVTTTHDAFGATLSVVDSDGRGPTYTYNKNGQALTVSDGGGALETRTYDRAGRLDSSTDGRNVLTRFAYDPASRLFTRTVDEGGLALQTKYEYDGQGRIFRVTEPGGRVTETTYYTDGRVKQIAVDPTGLNLRTYFEYDLAGNTTKKTEGYGSTAARTTTYLFDNLGRRVEEIVDPTGLNLHTQYKYDINGNVTRKIDASGYSTWYVYDADNRLVYTVNALGAVSKQTYDLNGRVIAITNYATPISTAAFGDVITSLTPTTGANDRLERVVFDRDGRAIYSIDALGIVTERTYDASGDVTRSLTYSRAIPVGGTYTSISAVQTALNTAGNTAGAPTTNDQVLYTAYDARGRAMFVVDALGDVVRNAYDAANNVLETRQYATTYSGAKTLAALNAWATGAIESNAANRITRHRYDNAGREKYTIDGAGAVTEYTYDGLGNVTRRLQYYNALAVSGTYDTFAQITTALGGAGNVAGSVSAADRVQWSAYDAAGRAEFVVDSIDGTNGAVKRVTYDGVGNIVQTQEFKAQRGLSLATDVATLRTWATSNTDTTATGDEFTAYWYDNAGRQRFELDAEGYFSEVRYNDANNSVTSVTYAVPATTHGLTRTSTYAQMNSAAALGANNVGARVVTSWRDAAGRERFVLDGERYLTEVRYNDAALQRTRYVYGPQLATGRLTTTSTLTDATSVAAAPDVAGGTGTGSTVSTYDADGRLSRVTYSLDASHEDYGYDVYGNKTSYSNQKGSVWTYVYDTAGNLREERTPTVSATTITSTGDAAALTQLPESVVIITRMTYNAFGNVATRTEGIRNVSGTENAAGSRVTSYGYDTMGRQTSTTLPTLSVYAPPANDEINTNASTMRRETSVTPTTITSYDALGNAVMNVDVGGAYSRKAYDNLGRVLYEVDALNYVTRYGYDTFGNKTTGTRFAGAMNTGSLGATAVWTRANIASNLVTGSADRVATTTYDRRNLQIRVLQPSTDVFVTQPNVAAGSTVVTAGGEAKYTYDAFGQVTKYQALIDPSTAKYAETYFFYDGKGQQTATVDAQGFVTTQEFDARGNVTRVVEYAQALTGSPPWNPASAISTTPSTVPNAVSGYDRDMRMTFNTLGRMTSRSILNVETSSVSSGNVSTSYQTQTTTYAYDAVGNLVSETNAAGTTYTYYDVLGRTTAIVEPTRNVDGTGAAVNVTPLTEMYRDVYGNIVREIRYANSATGVSANGYTKPPSGTNEESLLQYDLYGHAVRTTDSFGANRYVSYDVRGNVAKEWQPVTNADGVVQTLVKIHEYDALGHETATITPLRRSDVLPTSVGATRSDTMRLSQNYNPPLWTGQNVVQIVWPQQPSGAVRVELTYIQYSRNQANGPTVTRTQTFSNVTEDAIMQWTDPDSGAYGGVLQIVSVSVISIVNGVETPLGAQAAFYLSVGYAQSIYNAFGEVTKQGTNTSRQSVSTGNFQVLNEYDNAGHLWRTNAGDGARKIYYYDAAGRRTGEVRSQQGDLTAYNPSTALALSSTQAMRTETVYNGIDQIIEQRLPLFTASNGAAAAPSQKRKLDRWGNTIEGTDAGGQTTNYRYNVLSELVEAKQPTVSVLNTKVALTASNARPTQTNYYDVLGRLIATRDADNNLNSNDVNAAGQLLAERHADGGVKTFAYDAFGNQTLIVNELGNWTVQSYDLKNRLIRVQTQLTSAPDGLGGYTRTFITRDFVNDAAGRRISETSGETMVDGTPEKTKYFYDNNGNVANRRTPMGVNTWYEYDVFGNLVSQKDAVGGHLKWTYDSFGHMTTHVDMGGTSTTYTYDRAGLLDTQISTAGQNINYDYDAAGQLTTVTDTGVGRVTTLGYDTAGRRSRERTVINGRTHQDVAITYDALNRISTLTDLRYSITYQYDAQSNRTRTNGTALDHSNVSQVTDLWYTYDAMNRVKLSQAENASGTLGVSAKQGVAIFYDLAGRRTETDQYGTDMMQKIDNWNSSTQQHEISYRDRFGYYRETYSYDDADRLTFIARTGEFQNLVDGRESGSPSALPLDAAITRTYDNASRVVREDSWRIDPGTTVYTYDDDGHVMLQTVRTVGSTSGIRENETEFYYDAAGVLRQYLVTGFAPTQQLTEQQRYVASYQNSYLAADSYLLTTQGAVQVQGPDAPLLAGSTTRTYNANRELVSQTDSKSTLSNRWFFNNANGEAITVVGGPSVNTSNLDSVVAAVLNGGGTTYRPQHFFYANGNAVGSFGLQSRGDPNDATVRANFDVNFTKALDQVSPTLGGEAVAHAGDTLRTIASRYLGDANLWYLIADENGLSNPDAVLAVGISLRLPNKVVALSNSADVYKPFNAQAALGNITPHMAVVWKPPGPDKCAQAMMIVVIVAFMVISWYAAAVTAPVAGAAVTTQSVVAAAAGGAFSSLFSQAAMGALAVLEGGRAQINWKAVAATAITRGIAAGLSPAISSMAQSISKVQAVQEAITGVANNLIGQAVNIALKNQKSFSWGEVASAAITAPISKAMIDAAGGGPGASFATNAYLGAVQTMVNGGKVDVLAITADGFANMLGDAVTRSMGSRMQHNSAAQESARLDSIGESFLQKFNADHPDFAHSLFPDVDIAFGLDTGPEISMPSISASDAPTHFNFSQGNDSYTVAKGDSYARIAKQRYGDERFAASIMVANGIDPTYEAIHSLQVGAKLSLPDLSSLSDADQSGLLKVGGVINSADAFATRQVKKLQQFNRLADAARNHPESMEGVAGISMLTGMTPEEVLSMQEQDRNQRRLMEEDAQNWQARYAGAGMDIARSMGGTSQIDGLIAMSQKMDLFADKVHAFMNNPYVVRTLGTLQGVGSTVAAGAAFFAAAVTSETGIGAVAFGAVGVAEVDSAIAGFRQAWSGKYETPVIVQGAEALGVNPTVANLGFAGLTLYGGFSSAASIEARSLESIGIGNKIPRELDLLGELNGATKASAHPLEGMSVADVIARVDQLGLDTPRDSLLLWSGFENQGTKISKAYATEHGGMTLEMTKGGGWLDEVMNLPNNPFTRLERHEIFASTSRSLVAKASGQVRAILGRVYPDSILRTVELPEALANARITGVDEIRIRPIINLPPK